jgi:hypothetical protein
MLFAAWVVVGALGGFGVASLLTVGPVLMIVAGVLAGVLRWRWKAPGATLFGLGPGAAVPAAYLAWLNRGGPGTSCRVDGEGVSTCTETWAPWPFLAAAVMLTLGSVSLFLRFRRTARNRNR